MKIPEIRLCAPALTRIQQPLLDERGGRRFLAPPTGGEWPSRARGAGGGGGGGGAQSLAGFLSPSAATKPSKSKFAGSWLSG